MPKKIFIISILIISFGLLVFNFLKTQEAKAGPADNVWGWAWAENIGWISFNNCIDPTDIATTCGPEDYGVHICENDADPLCVAVTVPKEGKFVGYAWSRGTTANVGGIGWVRFDPPPDNITYPPACGYPESPCHSVRVSTTTGEVSGWARACAGTVNPGTCSGVPNPAAGGWDGWIKLGDSPHLPWPAGGQQVYIATTTGHFHGWAWGGGGQSAESAIIGWLSFNCETEQAAGFPNVCSNTNNYKVMTDFSFTPPNQRPAVFNAQITGINYCTKTDDSNGTQIGQVSFSWLYKDLEGDDQERYWLQVATDSGFSGLDINCQVPNSITADPNTSTTITSAVTVVSSGSDQLANACNDGLELGGRALAISYNGNYYWRVASKAATGNTEWSDWVAYGAPTSFATPAHAYPWPDFTHSPSLPEIGQEVEFIDSSVCYNNLNNPYPCSNQNPITSNYNRYQWDFDGDGFVDCDSGFFPPHDCRVNVTTTYAVVANYIAKLYVTDDSDHLATCDVTREIKIRFPLPEYREVRPRSQLDNFLARIAGIFR